MNVTINTLNICGGGNHISFDVTVGSRGINFVTDWDEILDNDSPESNVVIPRLRSFCRENNLGRNFTILKTTLEGRSFKI